MELGDETRIPIVYEDRSVIAIDKPPGWMIVPFTWQKTDRNLQAAIASSIAARDFWARSRNLKYLLHVHRLDGETSGILLFGKSPGAVRAYGDLFESRKMEKTYLVVVEGIPKQTEWSSTSRIGPEPGMPGRMKIDANAGKEAITEFKLLRSTPPGVKPQRSLIEASPYTGRTHQIRLHLAEAGIPVVGDDLYGAPPAPARGKPAASAPAPTMALRAISLCYSDPFTRRAIRIRAPSEGFLTAFGFGEAPKASPKPAAA
jgi:23S rRNA pseudouridine1911/1915/1917 synthase